MRNATFEYAKRRAKRSSGPPAVQPAPALSSFNYTAYSVVDGILQLAKNEFARNVSRIEKGDL